MDNIIRVLSEHTINQIAAGEVIENPASVIKELVENSLDAGAKKITVEILAGGQQLISVRDDGVGMSPQDAVLSLERYATSKISTFDDLFSLRSMGFRGEALASIGAISRLTLTTAKEGRPGTCIEMEGGKILRVVPYARTQGTTIEVKSLFYNVPARKKFQKSVGANTGEIHRTMVSLSLAHPLIEFTLLQREEVLLATGPCEEEEFSRSLQKRIASVLGEEFCSISHNVAYEENIYGIHGLIGSPEHTRPHRTGQYLFVNHRPVFSPMISHVVREAYGTRISTGRHPVYVMHLSVPSELVDVNVHPQKKEIRFREEPYVREIITKATKQAFGEKEILPVNFLDAPYSLTQKEERQEFHFFEKQEGSSESKNFPLLFSFDEEKSEPVLFVRPLQPVGIFKQYLLVHAGTIKDREVFSEAQVEEDDLVMVDLIAAQEALFFTKLVDKKTESQELLLPVKIPLSFSDGKLVEENKEVFHNLGIGMNSISTSVYAVESAPALLSLSEIPKIVMEIVDQLRVKQTMEMEEESRQIHFASHLAQFAKAQKPPFMLQEAIALLEKLLCCRDPFFTSQGKPTMVRVKSDDIQEFFKSKKYRILS